EPSSAGAPRSSTETPLTFSTTSFCAAPAEDGSPDPITALREALMAAGFDSTPKGLRIRR
ncbi:hypothetical protein, partial [Rothia kristinae]|uniref:hypothetical protein n=1 Tax=Rothia kristinae TaxID=37923 RepID=UPI000A4A2978